MEAMVCGAALVASKIGGIEDYAVSGDNALLVPTNNLDLFVNTICELMSDNSRRIQIGTTGSKVVEKFSLEN
ncbi:glycosyltransferase [Oenococcus oeni]